MFFSRTDKLEPIGDRTVREKGQAKKLADSVGYDAVIGGFHYRGISAEQHGSER